MHEPDPATFDADVLAELQASMDDAAFVVELADAYLADGVQQVEAIEAAIAAGDADALVRPAHTLKSSSATVGAPRLAELSRRLEMAGRAGSVAAEGVPDASVLRAEWDAAGDAIRGWIEATRR